eukprot:CAMPEP_0175041888 /NCGR_PEP_ID=MMETSP0052_2-20121109/2205_1 /TAXON_ID=51329 ORGANISM="Polytomella parva, Strain SAG 63-3" /NCGR_SAMPLE_ID=MMETSP0052_2 /ASSEMBLY_ACC=CAM_ASM_000194 /LENGTH=146 /DNA_ID=CAMNT_0016304533 /DNA_START=985 /DNA_END=1421 /DNA_ORIENTATION=-
MSGENLVKVWKAVVKHTKSKSKGVSNSDGEGDRRRRVLGDVKRRRVFEDKSLIESSFSFSPSDSLTPRSSPSQGPIQEQKDVITNLESLERAFLNDLDRLFPNDQRGNKRYISLMERENRSSSSPKALERAQERISTEGGGDNDGG